MKLIRQFPLRPIRNDADFDIATDVLGRLAVRIEGTLDPGEQDYFEVLTELVSQYDDLFPVEKSDPIDILKYLMEEHRLNVTDLGRLIGSKGNASEILSGKRQLSRAQMFKLAERFGVKPGLFLAPAKKSAAK
jgi:HTH-type transcriptional regulator/antitoxin HigA